MIRIIIKIAGALVVGAAIFFSNYFPTQLYRNVAAVIAGVLFLFIDPLLDLGEKLKKSKENRKVISSYVLSFSKFLNRFTDNSINVKELVSKIEKEDMAYRKDNVIRYSIEKEFGPSSDAIKDAIFLMALCHEINDEGDEIKVSLYKQRISEILSKYDFIEFGDEPEIIMRYYFNFKNGNKLTEAMPSDVDLKAVFDSFSKKYNALANLAYNMYLEKEQVEEFRKTLSILVSRGRLSLKQLGKDTIKKINEEIEVKTRRSQAFLLLSSEFYKIPAVDHSINKFPNIQFGRKKGIHLPEEIK